MLFDQLEPWHWLTFGIILLVLEVLGAAGFLLGMAISAIATALVLAIAPDLSWQVQVVIFGVLSVVSTWIYWARFRNFNQETDQPLLNQRATALIGRSVKLLEAVENGRGKIQIGDALWTVESEQDISAGATVEIVDTEGMQLKVIPKEVPEDTSEQTREEAEASNETKTTNETQAPKETGA